MSRSPRVLFLLNPGRLSRHYVVGLVNAARRVGIDYATLELEPLWRKIAGSDPQGAMREVHAGVARLVSSLGITHAVGYCHTGTSDLGLRRGEHPTLLASLGVRHIMLWTDHPNWLLNGCSLDEPLRWALDHPLHTHVLKSGTAADEARAVLGWRNLHAVAVGEDFENLLPQSGVECVHDAVAIVGGAEPVPRELIASLADDAPDPAALDTLRRAAAVRAFREFVAREPGGSGRAASLDALASRWLNLKLARPRDSFFRLSLEVDAEHGDALAFLRGTARRWYGAVAALRTMVAWRRSFTLAWLARRVNMGVYGASGAPLGIAQQPGADGWVDYDRQSGVYSRGACAININAAWDEEGCSHKPFQIAASGAACVHWATRGLEELFDPRHEIAVGAHPHHMLDHIRSLAGSSRARSAMAEAMRERGKLDHDWTNRLELLLDLSEVTTGTRANEPAMAVTAPSSRTGSVRDAGGRIA